MNFNEVTFMLSAKDLLNKTYNPSELQIVATILKRLAIKKQDYPQAVIFRDIEKYPENYQQTLDK